MKKILSVVTALTLFGAGMAFGQDIEEFEEFEDTSTPALNISGSAGASGRVWIDTDEVKSGSKGSDLEIEKNAYVNLDLEYSANSSDFAAKLTFDTSKLTAYPEDILQEFVARGYFADGALTIEAGKQKLVWGKGDKQHVLDNFNANDYTDFVIPDYIDRRIAEPMFHITAAPSYMNDYISNIKFEGVWTPMMTPDRFAEDGQWYPNAQKTLSDLVSSAVGYNLALDVAAATGDRDLPSAITAVSSIMAASDFSSDKLYADNIKTLKYGQAGARLTYTMFGIDMGFSYYYGHYKQPTADLSPYINGIKSNVMSYALSHMAEMEAAYGTEIGDLAISKYADYYTSLVGQTVKDPVTGADVTIAGLTEISALAQSAATVEVLGNHADEIFLATGQKYELPSLNFDQVQTFGVEAAFVLPSWLFGLNTRYEFAYNLTEDTAGDNPWVKNNSIGWVAGFDRDLPIHNINVNFQTVGKYVLKNDKITDEHDTDFNTDGKYTNNKLILNISDKFDHEKLVVECTGVYVVETKGLLVMPKIEYTCVDGFALGLSGAFIKSDNENCEFYNFTANAKDNWKAFVQLSGKYQF